MESRQTAARDSAPALPGTQAADSPQVPARTPAAAGAAERGTPVPAQQQFWGCGDWRDAELSTAAPRGDAVEAAGAPRCVAAPLGRWEAAPGRQAPLAHQSAREPRVAHCHGRVRHPGPLTGAGRGPISGGPSSQPTAPPRQPHGKGSDHRSSAGRHRGPAGLGRPPGQPRSPSRDGSHRSPQTLSSAWSLPAAPAVPPLLPHSAPHPEEPSTGTTGIAQ